MTVNYILLRNLQVHILLPVFDVIQDTECHHLRERLKQENWSEEKIEEFQHKVKLLQTA